MADRTFRLALSAPLHVGDIGIGVEESLPYLPSDTLFSALVITWLEMNQHALVANLLTDFAAQPPLLLTSCFPYAGPVHLLPRPLLPVHPEGGGKGYKRVHWVSSQIFARLINGITPGELTDLWNNANREGAASGLLQDGRVWVTSAERTEIAAGLHQEERQTLTLWASEKRPHVAIDRITSRSNLYHVGAVRFTTGCGIWCSVRGETAWVERTAQALRLMADSGVGGRRSRGYGRFTLNEAKPMALPAVNGGSHQVLLSRFAPTEAEMALLRAPGASYGLVTVGGWSQNLRNIPIMRQKVRFLSEGSVIQQSNRVPGQLLNLKPPQTPPQYNHPVHRYGFGFATAARLADSLLLTEEEL
jgi:CRISPR-associated protein Csm4